MAAGGTRAQQRHQERVVVPYQDAGHATTFSVILGHFKDRVVRLDNVTYTNPTGFASGATGWIIAITDGTNTLASWNTTTGQQGAIAANTPVDLVLASGAAPQHDCGAGLPLTVQITIVGAAGALPAGQLLIDGHAL